MEGIPFNGRLAYTRLSGNWYICDKAERNGYAMYLWRDGKWHPSCDYTQGRWISQEEAIAFLIGHSVPSTPEYDEYDQSEEP